MHGKRKALHREHGIPFPIRSSSNKKKRENKTPYCTTDKKRSIRMPVLVHIIVPRSICLTLIVQVIAARSVGRLSG
jgi:hypothetical protein